MSKGDGFSRTQYRGLPRAKQAGREGAEHSESMVRNDNLQNADSPYTALPTLFRHKLVFSQNRIQSGIHCLFEPFSDLLNQKHEEFHWSRSTAIMAELRL
ncbi:hypothetical protein Pla22_08550 [Rubripirellula amarantea]|uniref:Uncharacterized protein n=1 Tax=Rubripirellula amarantea TaxID=2527999 RepID=A0A5C5WRR6_9BACT|nr:hypothetical protein Pla22_08550 [Rubripirellula amarantea]